MFQFFLLIWLIIFIGGYLLIYFFADIFLENLRDLCIIYEVSPFIIGLLILGIDPEESIASILASINGLTYVAIGNVIGNSIISLTLCFALAALFYKIEIERIPNFYFIIIFSSLFSIIFSFLFYSGLFIFGISCLLIYVVYISRSLIHISREKKLDISFYEGILEEDTETYEVSKNKMILLIILSFLLILGGGEMLILATGELITLTGISESIFGFIIIAFMTNVEELTLIIKSIKKHSVEIGFGGMIGKIIWNLTITFGVSGIIAVNIIFDWNLIWNWIILIIVIFYYYIISYKKNLNRKDGVLLLIIFAFFLFLNFVLAIQIQVF
ncbi:MAG: sodium:calcium antiporter [Candidatus Helarchaeota archaeon]